MKIHFVYALKSSLDQKVFYIGKSVCDGVHFEWRLWKHLYNTKRGANFPVHCKIRKILRLGGFVVSEVLFKTEIEAQAWNEEARVIAEYGIDNLTNLSHGGPGPSGWHHSDETKAALSGIARKFRHTAETRKRMSDKAKLRYSKMSSDARRASVAAATRAAAEAPWTAQKSANMSAGLKKQWAQLSPEARRLRIKVWCDAGNAAQAKTEAA